MFERASKKLGMEHAVFQKGTFNEDLETDGGMTLRGLADLK